MRITPFILICIAVAGLLFPHYFIAEDKGDGRWVFAIILLLGVFSLWRTIKRMKDRDR